MIHIIFNRPSSEMKVFAGGVMRYKFEANGSAWGDGGPNHPYGYQCQIAPGHYKLTHVERINPPIPSEGAGQIFVADLTTRDISQLAIAKRAKWIGADVTIGGSVLPIGGIGKYNRTEIMLHGGGSNLGEPACFEPHQLLCRTFGCTRLHNADLAALMDMLEPVFAAGNEHVIYSVIGDSPELPR